MRIAVMLGNRIFGRYYRFKAGDQWTQSRDVQIFIILLLKHLTLTNSFRLFMDHGVFALALCCSSPDSKGRISPTVIFVYFPPPRACLQ